MTVAELIDRLQQSENPEEKEILIKDTATGNRDIERIEDSLGVYYTIYTERHKTRK